MSILTRVLSGDTPHPKLADFRASLRARSSPMVASYLIPPTGPSHRLPASSSRYGSRRTASADWPGRVAGLAAQKWGSDDQRGGGVPSGCVYRVTRRGFYPSVGRRARIGGSP